MLVASSSSQASKMSFAEAQYAILERAFEKKPYQSRGDYDRLVVETGLTRKQLFGWFSQKRKHHAASLSTKRRQGRATIYTAARTQKLHAAMRVHGMYPNVSVYEDLSTELGFTRKQIRRWFLNQRTKLRKDPLGQEFSERQQAVLRCHLDKFSSTSHPEDLIKELAKKLRRGKLQVSQWFAKNHTRRGELKHDDTLDSDLDNLLNDDSALDLLVNGSDSNQHLEVASSSRPDYPPAKAKGKCKIDDRLTQLAEEFDQKLFVTSLELQKQIDDVKHEVIQLRHLMCPPSEANSSILVPSSYWREESYAMLPTNSDYQSSHYSSSPSPYDLKFSIQKSCYSEHRYQ